MRLHQKLRLSQAALHSSTDPNTMNSKSYSMLRQTEE